MKKRLLFYILLSAFSFVPAQEYLPLHLSYKPIVKEREVSVEEVVFTLPNKSYTTFDLYKNKVDSISFETVKDIKEKYHLSKVAQYAYWKDKKGNPLFEVTTRIIQSNSTMENYKKYIPFWLSFYQGRFINSSKAIGIVEKHKNKFRIWDKKTAIKRLTSIETPEEALYFLYLMEYVFPEYNFDELCKKEENYQICTDTITPTIVKEEKDYFVINLFHYNIVDGSFFEIVYQLYKNGKYNILSKKRIYIILAEGWE